MFVQLLGIEERGELGIGSTLCLHSWLVVIVVRAAFSGFRNAKCLFDVEDYLRCFSLAWKSVRSVLASIVR